MKSILIISSFFTLFIAGSLGAQSQFLIIQTSLKNTTATGIRQKPAQTHPATKNLGTRQQKPGFFDRLAGFLPPPFAKGCKTDGFGLTAFILGFLSLLLPVVPGIIVLGVTLTLAIISLVRISQRSCRNPSSGSNGKALLKGRGFAYVAIIGALLVLGILLLGTLIV